MTNIETNTLLVVDDIPTNIKVLFDYLKSIGFKVRIAKSGENALTQVALSPPDLILLDVMMPKMDGFEVCRRLKADEKTREIPVIFMTAKTDTVDKVKGFEVGAVDYVTKPFQQEEVLARINAHLTIRQLQKSLQQHNQELDAFAHSVAHDLKNPVNVITNYTEMLIEDLSPIIRSESLQMLQSTRQAASNLVNIIDALLLLSSARQQDIEMQVLSMDDIVKHVQFRLAKMIEECHGQIIAPTQWPNALGYAPWITEVWANYISNGLKYGGNPPRLELGAEPQENQQICFWIHDNGQGLTEDEQSQLFVPFTRLSHARVEGQGLGLSIVERIIERCGGQVGVNSQIGQGSTFYFTLPKA
jgi:two-component system, sensor histidine kinase and response regulator